MKYTYEMIERDVVETIDWKSVSEVPVHVFRLSEYSDSRLNEVNRAFEAIEPQIYNKMREHREKGITMFTAYLEDRHADVLFILDEVRKERLSRLPKW